MTRHSLSQLVCIFAAGHRADAVRRFIEALRRRARAALLAGAAAVSTAAVSTAAVADEPLTLAISEGTSGGSFSTLRLIALGEKYDGLVRTMEGALKRKVTISFVRSFDKLENRLREGSFAFVMARPSDYPARALRDYGYRYIATARPEGQCLLIVPAGSPLKTPAELKGRTVLLPEPAAYMAKFCIAELRDHGVTAANTTFTHVADQSGVVQLLADRRADAGGIASYSGVVADLPGRQMRVMHRSRPQPYSPMVASRQISADDLGAVRRALATLERTPEGRATLKSIGFDGFSFDTEPRLGELLDWLGRR